jgi:hypothetical protein
MLPAAVAPAQEKPSDPITPLEQAAETRTSEWDILATGLEARIIRLLPCDPRVQSAIEEVSRASDARMSALEQYFRAVVAKAKDQTEAAKVLLTGQEAMSKEWSGERADAGEERTGIDAQIGGLAASVKQRSALADAQKALDGIVALMGQRAAGTERRVDQAAALSAMLGGLAAAYQRRQAALETEMAAVTAERERWSVYYAARLARAQTECTITKPGATRAPLPPQQKKRIQ